MNNLTPAQHERLSKLVEELGESLQVAGKILLHGYAPTQFEKQKFNNKQDLEHEMGDILAIMHLMMQAGDVDTGKIVDARDAKMVLLKDRLRYQNSR